MKIESYCANSHGSLPTELANQMAADLGSSNVLYAQSFLSSSCRFWVALADEPITLTSTKAAFVLGDLVDCHGKRLIATDGRGNLLTEQVPVETRILAIAGLKPPSYPAAITVRMWSPNDSQACLIAKAKLRDAAFASVQHWAANISLSVY